MTQQQLDPASQLEHIYRLHSDLHQDTQQLRTALYTNGIWRAGADAVRKEYLPIYLARLCERWQIFIRSHLPERQAEVVIRRYCLNGQVRPVLKVLAAEYGISRTELWEIEVSGMSELRSKQGAKMLHQIALEMVHEVLALTPPSIAPLDNG